MCWSIQNGVSCSHYFHKRKLQFIRWKCIYRELQQRQNKNDTVKSLTNWIVDNIFHFMLQFNLKLKCVKYKSRKLFSSANKPQRFPSCTYYISGWLRSSCTSSQDISSFSDVANIIPGNSLHPFLFVLKEGGKTTNASSSCGSHMGKYIFQISKILFIGNINSQFGGSKAILCDICWFYSAVRMERSLKFTRKEYDDYNNLANFNTGTNKRFEPASAMTI